MRGFTLVELLVALALGALLLAVLFPRMDRLRDGLAVRGAREEVVGLLARARLQALLGEGAEVVALEGPSRIVVRAPRSVATRLDLEREYGVELVIPGPTDRATLRFDALGIGRMASRTLSFRRRDAEVFLSVSSYGRVRRR